MYPSGGQYEGAFANGKKHGYGIYKYKDGTKITGYWENDDYRGKLKDGKKIPK